jgi:hypothetical protein
VLILRDVLGFHASEVAGMLDVTVESVTSALKRARASLQRRLPPGDGRQPPPAAGSPAEKAIVARFATAWQSADLDALVGASRRSGRRGARQQLGYLVGPGRPFPAAPSAKASSEAAV